MKFTNFLRTIVLKNICERLVLNIKKETRTQVLSCEFLKLFKNNFSRGSTNGLLWNPGEGVFL